MKLEKIGYNSEFGRIKSVMIHIPREEELNLVAADDAMYEFQPDYNKVLKEIWDYIELLASLGITVYHDAEVDLKPFPNMIYMRDIGGILHDGIIIGRLKYPIRWGEENNLIKILKHYNYTGKQLILPYQYKYEGADMFHTGANELTFAIGNRTHWEAAEFIKADSPEMSIRSVSARPEGIPQHMMGTKMIVDKDLVIIRKELSQFEIGHHMTPIWLEETDEVKNRYATNLVCIGPREVIMADDCPETQKIFESYGIKCHTSPMKELHKMAGGFACATLILEREFIEW